MSKRPKPQFAWVSPLVNFKKRLFSNKHKEVIANNGTNKGATEAKLGSHVGATPFSYLCCFPDLLKKWVSPLVHKSDQFNICCNPPPPFFSSLYLSPFSWFFKFPGYPPYMSLTLSLPCSPSLSLFLFLPPIYPMFLFSDFTIIFFFFTFCFSLFVCVSITKHINMSTLDSLQSSQLHKHV